MRTASQISMPASFPRSSSVDQGPNIAATTMRSVLTIMSDVVLCGVKVLRVETVPERGRGSGSRAVRTATHRLSVLRLRL